MASEANSGDRPVTPPPTSAHRLIGMLSVSFAGVMLLCGACGSVSMLMQVAMAPLSEGYQRTMVEALKAQRQQERDKSIAELKVQEEAAVTEEEKAQLAAQRQTLEAQPIVDLPVADMMGMYREPTFIGYLVADTITGLVLNALLLTSGIGLLAAKSWARKLAIWVAALKIARLVFVYGFAIAFVVPTFSKQMGKVAEQMVGQLPSRPGAPPMPPAGQTIATAYGIALTSSAVLMILFGAIYPVIMLWVLTRPKVKAACGEAAAPRSAESP